MTPITRRMLQPSGQRQLRPKNMIRFLLSLSIAGLLPISLGRADEKPATIVKPATATPAAQATPSVKLPPQAPDVPAPKLGLDGQPNAGFMAAHERFVKIAGEGKAQLLFLGDSITAGWGGNGKAIWTQTFAEWEPVNFGIGGDRTQHVLWRIKNGELDGIKPKVAVLMIGTNNVGGDAAEGIASGITKIVETIREKTPTTRSSFSPFFLAEKSRIPGVRSSRR